MIVLHLGLHQKLLERWAVVLLSMIGVMMSVMMVALMITFELVMSVSVMLLSLTWVVLQTAYNHWVQNRQALVHEVRGGKLFHIDRIMDQHGGVAINERSQNVILFVWHERDFAVDDLVCLYRVVNGICTQIIVDGLSDLCCCLAVHLGVLDVRE